MHVLQDNPVTQLGRHVQGGLSHWLLALTEGHVVYFVRCDSETQFLS